MRPAGQRPGDEDRARQDGPDRFVLPVGELPTRGPISTDMPVPAVAVAVGAHPDDIDFGCGATLAKWAAHGCVTHHVVMTDGSKGTWDPRVDTTALVTTRRHEQERAAAILGSSSVTFLDNVDGELASDATQRRALCEVIRRLRPTVVLGHDPWRRYRLHPDHRNAGFLAVDGIVAARDPHFFPEQDAPPHRPSALLLFEADEPDHIEDVSGFVDTKIAALLEHRSQLRSTMAIGDDATDGGIDPAHPEVAAFRQRVIDRLAEGGALGSIPYAEKFKKIDRL